MSSDELDIGSWQNQLKVLGSPVIRWRGSKSFAVFSFASIFVFISLIIPQKYMKITSAGQLSVGSDIEKLQEQIEALKEEKIIPEEKADDFEQKLEQLRDTASGSDPVKTWEALDHIKQNMKNKADEAAVSALSQTENLTKAQALSEGLSEVASEISDNVYSEAVSELSALMKALISKNQELKNNLDPNLVSAAEKGNLTAEQLKQLAELLKANKLQVSANLSKLCNAGLVDYKMLGMCKAAGQCDVNDLKEFLCKDANSICIGDGLAMCCGPRPGKGGVSRGRADAPMTWTEGSSEEGAKFKEQVLPQASLAALKESMMIGVSIAAPTVEIGTEKLSADVLGSAKAGGGEAFSHTILPHHKAAVKNYFEREEK